MPKWEMRFILASFTCSILLLSAAATFAGPNDQKIPKPQGECSFINAQDPKSIVNIRQGPGTQFPVLAGLHRGDTVIATHKEGDWVRVVARFTGYEPDAIYYSLQGWVHKNFINGCSEDKFEMWRM